MPIKNCQSDKKKGYKYGDSGYCYTGNNSLKKAKKQGRAIEASKSRKKRGLAAASKSTRRRVARKGGMTKKKK